MRWLLALLSLIKRILFGKKANGKEGEAEEESYTREQFIEAVKELSNDPVWRVRILRDALSELKKMKEFRTEWIDNHPVIQQSLHRQFGCGLSYVFGDGIYAMPKDDWMWLINALQQDVIEYVKRMTDCDNFATFFKGFADYVVGKPVVIYTTGLVLRPVEQMGQKICICKSEYLVGGHGWNRIVTTEETEYQRVGTARIVRDDFRVYNYEPQNDRLGDKFVGGWCYQSGGYLPIIYGRKVNGGDE